MKQVEEESDGPQSTIEELVAVPLKEEEPAKVILIGASLPEEQKSEMLGFLRHNEDVFAWSHDDMPGIDPAHSCHRLNIDPHFPTVKGDFEVKEPRLHRYYSKVMGASARFASFSIEQIPREENQRADTLAKNASTGGIDENIEVWLDSGGATDPTQTHARHVLSTSTSDEGWMRPIAQYLTLGNLPTDPQEARAIRLKAARYSMIGEQLYRSEGYGAVKQGKPKPSPLRPKTSRVTAAT
ncbi:hypothetical protein PanWU01x14_252230 [Parasponia andersonii]|uniref:RNase H type-1 domain-containing protein n=1 Tax=Parasponia andersonii TaxID=3476 RepID=A0A2P5BC53_PARAD|nr:hypothetical protein PanWU01x14_252230 [Parasponia andersonii]